MRTSVSWIRAVVPDLPDVSTEELAARLTALGLKLEAIERPGHDITGPLVVGRVLSFEDEPQSNGKTIRWCSVDVGAANGTGEPQGIVCGAHNFAVGDLVAGDPARRRAARRLRDLRAQDLRPRVRRDDLLGQGARPRRRPRRHHRAARRRRRAGRRRLRRAAAARRGHRVRDQPRPRVRPVAARCRPRGRAGLRPRRSPTRPTGRCRRRPRSRTRSWSRTRSAARSSPAGR